MSSFLRSVTSFISSYSPFQETPLVKINSALDQFKKVEHDRIKKQEAVKNLEELFTKYATQLKPKQINSLYEKIADLDVARMPSEIQRHLANISLTLIAQKIKADANEAVENLSVFIDHYRSVLTDEHFGAIKKLIYAPELKKLNPIAKDLAAQIDYFVQYEYFPHEGTPATKKILDTKSRIERGSSLEPQIVSALFNSDSKVLNALPQRFVQACLPEKLPLSTDKQKDDFAKNILTQAQTAMQLYSAKEQQDFCAPDTYFNIQIQLTKEIFKTLGEDSKYLGMATDLAKKATSTMLMSVLKEEHLPKILVRHFNALAKDHFDKAEAEYHAYLQDTKGKSQIPKDKFMLQRLDALKAQADFTAGQLISAFCEHPEGQAWAKKVLVPENRVAFQKTLDEALKKTIYGKQSALYAQWMMQGVIQKAVTIGTSNETNLVLNKISDPAFSGHVRLMLPLDDAKYLDEDRELGLTFKSGENSQVELQVEVEKGKLKHIAASVSGDPAVRVIRNNTVYFSPRRVDVQVDKKGQVRLQTKILGIPVDKKLFDLNLSETSTFKDFFQRNEMRKAQASFNSTDAEFSDIFHPRKPLKLTFKQAGVEDALLQSDEDRLALRMQLPDLEGVELPYGFTVKTNKNALIVQLKLKQDGSIDEKNTHIKFFPEVSLQLKGKHVITFSELRLEKDEQGQLFFNLDIPSTLNIKQYMVNSALNFFLKNKLQGNIKAKITQDDKPVAGPPRDENFTGFKPDQLLELFQLQNIDYASVTFNKPQL